MALSNWRIFSEEDEYDEYDEYDDKIVAADDEDKDYEDEDEEYDENEDEDDEPVENRRRKKKRGRKPGRRRNNWKIIMNTKRINLFRKRLVNVSYKEKSMKMRLNRHICFYVYLIEQ